MEYIELFIYLFRGDIVNGNDELIEKCEKVLDKLYSEDTLYFNKHVFRDEVHEFYGENNKEILWGDFFAREEDSDLELNSAKKVWRRYCILKRISYTMVPDDFESIRLPSDI